MADAVYRRFATGTQAHTKLELSNGMKEYLNEKFKIFVKDKAIQESVLDLNPVPDAESLKTPKVDGYLDEIFETLGKSYGRESDGTLSKTQARINNVMGPLGKLWLNLENIRTGESSDELDLFGCLTLVEQSVTLLGQANVSLTYARRLSILGRLTGDMKKAKKLLNKHESSLSSSHKNLFGKRFYKALSKATKIRKSTKDISHHLSGPSKPSRPSGSNLSGVINSDCSSSSTVHGAEHSGPKHPIGWAAAPFSEQLAITDTGSVHFANDTGSPDFLCRNPKAVAAPSQTFHNKLERHTIEQEITKMLQKGAIQVVYHLKWEFLSTVFLVKNKDGGTDL